MADWSLLPTVVLRQAGFPFETLAGLGAPTAPPEASGLVAAEAECRQHAARLKVAFREADLPDRDVMASWLGYLRPFADDALNDLTARLPAAAQPVLRGYQELAVHLVDDWRAWEERHQQRVAAASGAVVAAFRRDALLRDALLLSNDANYALYDAWLANPGDLVGKRGRKMVDLLTRYLQRFAAKNETHSHFGPISVGRTSQDIAGVDWNWGPSQRRTFFSHWAAERLSSTLTAHPELDEKVRPRRRPWAFLRDDTITLYAFTTEDGLAADWRFRVDARTGVATTQRDLFERCCGERTTAELRRAFHQEMGEGFQQALDFLAGQGLVVTRFEVPVGDPHPLPGLRRLIGANHPAAGTLDDLEKRVGAIALSGLPERPARVAELKERYEEATGESANRGAGRHYADRSVFFEECHGPVHDFRLGRDMVDFVERELAPVYELALAGPRLRLIREREVLSTWLGKRFGHGARVPLDLFYDAYFKDRELLLAECDAVDQEVERLDRDLTRTLLGSADSAVAEVEVDQRRLLDFLERCPQEPAALCNPDIMFAAADAPAFGRGEFTAVVGDCHAVRELLSHSSFAPLVVERVPELAHDVVAAYQQLVEPDELLCDMARSHPDKTATQIDLPIADVEIFGRSAKPRGEVIQPSQLYIAVGDRLELRATGRPERLRLLAPPSGGPTIRLDPLAVFSFARRIGGLGLQADHLPHVPRIRAGRVVLQRELWRIPAGELRGRTVGGGNKKGDAAEYYAACALRDRYRLPRHVFAKVAHEPKPLFVDFASPLLVRQLFRMVRGAAGAVEFSEMLPGPEHLWLARDGERFTTEIRCAVVSAGRSPRDGRTTEGSADTNG